MRRKLHAKYVAVYVTEFEFSHGHRPRGRGHWIFAFGDTVAAAREALEAWITCTENAKRTEMEAEGPIFRTSGLWSQAIAVATKAAAERGYPLVYVAS